MKESKQTESSILHGIQQALGMRGWRLWRMPPSIYGKKGLPDLCACKYGITVWLEIKSEKGKMSIHQERFAKEVDMAGGLYILARSVEFAVKAVDSIELAFCDLSGEVSGTIKPDKRMKLICNLSDKGRN